MLGALLTLITGVAYNHIASCYSITYMYLAGAYPLYLAFTVICLYNVCVDIVTKIDVKKILLKRGKKLW